MWVQLRRLGPNPQVKTLSHSDNHHVWTAGRGSQCDIFTQSKFASRKHFSIIYKENKFYLCDHGSANGTFLNNKRIEPSREYLLSLECIISVGVPSNLENDTNCIVFIFESCPTGISNSEDSKNDLKQKAESTKELSLEPENKKMKYDLSCSEKSDCFIISENLINSKVREKNVDHHEPQKTKSSVDLHNDIKNLQICDVEAVQPEEPYKIPESEVQNHFYADEEMMDNNDGSNKKFDDDLFVVSLSDDEDSKAYGAQTQVDASQDGNPRLSYSMNEELIEISDSEDDWPIMLQMKTEVDNFSSSIPNQEEADYYEDDVIFVDSVIKSNNMKPAPKIEIKVEEEDDYTEVDKKWMGKLFKTKEECDSFIQSQRESNDECIECEENDDWISIVSHFADEIGKQISIEETKYKGNDKSPTEENKEASEKDVTKKDEEPNSSDPPAGLDESGDSEPNLVIDESDSTLVKESSKDVSSEKAADFEEKSDNIPNRRNEIEKPVSLHSSEKKDEREVISDKSGKTSKTIHKVSCRKSLEGEKSAEYQCPRFSIVQKDESGSLTSSSHSEKQISQKEKKRRVSDKSSNDSLQNDAKRTLKKPRLIPPIPKKSNSSRGPAYSNENKADKSAPVVPGVHEPGAPKTRRKRKKKKPAGSITPTERKRIRDRRKDKLRELTVRESRPYTDHHSTVTVQKTGAPIKIKITHKNRNDYLCEGFLSNRNVDKDRDDSCNRSGKWRREALQPFSAFQENDHRRKNENDAHDLETIRLNTGLNEFNCEKSNCLPDRVDDSECGGNRITIVSHTNGNRVLKSCLKKFGYAFMKSNRPIVAKHSVRFENTPTVRYFEVDKTLKKIPPTAVSNMKTKTISMIEEGWIRFRHVFLNICSWNTAWLEESKKVQDGVVPPAAEMKKLKRVPKKFSSHDEYMKTFIPLLLLELWFTLSAKWKSSEAQMNRFAAICTSFVCSENDPTGQLGIMNCICLVPSCNDTTSLVKEGDLLMIQLCQSPVAAEEDQSQGRNAKKLVFRIFGFTEKKCLEQVNFSKVPPMLAQDCHGLQGNGQIMKLSILVKSRPQFLVHMNKTVFVTVLHHITPELRLCRAVCNLPKSPICKTILSPNRPDMILSPALKKEDIFFNGPLDNVQKDLILKLVASCANRNYNLLQIEGGPGTGKTHISIALILQLLFSKEFKSSSRPKILYCSHSNVVVDNVARMLKNYRDSLTQALRYKLVRVGNLSSIRPSVRDLSSHQLALVSMAQGSNSDEIKELDLKIKTLAADLEKGVNLTEEESGRMSNALHEYVKLREIMKNSGFASGVKEPSYETESCVIENADVICATCSSSGTHKMIEIFDRIRSKSGQKIVCIIDEAMQSIETETLVPLQLGVTHLILIGDSQQLRSPYKHEKTWSLGLNQSLFWRISSFFDSNKTGLTPVYTLRTQYRMSPKISMFPNKIFYKNTLKDGCFRTKIFEIEEFLFLVDDGAMRCLNENSETRIHFIAKLIVYDILYTTSRQKTPCTILVVTCQLDQAKALRALIDDRQARVEIQPIENVQGKEYDIVIFLFDAQMTSSHRANVALTRAKHSLIVLTSKTTDKNNKFLTKLADEAASRKALIPLGPNMNQQSIHKIITGCKYQYF